MKQGTEGYLVKTGLSGGLDIYFGNGSFGKIPTTGASIQVEYVITEGASGNLTGSKDLAFEFISPGYDSLGNEYNLNELLEASFTVAPRMGANPESTQLTNDILWTENS